MPQLILNLTDEQAVRICGAVGRMGGLRTAGDTLAKPEIAPQARPATLDEVAQRACGYLCAIVEEQDHQAAVNAAKAQAAELGSISTSIK